MKHRIFAFVLMVCVIAMPFVVAVAVTSDLVLDFVFFYPLLMSALWMAGGLYFYLHLEREWKWGDRLEDREVPPLPGSPQVAIIIPCFNEEKKDRKSVV